jgi:NTP pyrophosphatase (non-canonical NTP hydrolase)
METDSNLQNTETSELRRLLAEEKSKAFKEIIQSKCREAFLIEKSKGFHEVKRSNLELYALIVSEVAEAIEEARYDRPALYQLREMAPAIVKLDEVEKPVAYGSEEMPWDPRLKPEGQLSEIADVVIRCFDLCGSLGWDLGLAIQLKMDYNLSRPYKHGKNI